MFKPLRRNVFVGREKDGLEARLEPEKGYQEKRPLWIQECGETEKEQKLMESQTGSEGVGAILSHIIKASESARCFTTWSRVRAHSRNK